jgi:TonB family protein
MGLPKIGLSLIGASTISSITLKCIQKHFHGWQNNTRLFAIVAFTTSCAWVVTLTQTEVFVEHIPWLVVLVGMAFAWLVVLLPAGPVQASFNFVHLTQESDLSLKHWLSMTYSTFSLVLVLMLFQIKNHPWHPLESRQFIDIQLTSFADFQDKKELLPSTEPHASLRKRQGSLVDQTFDARSISQLSQEPKLSRTQNRSKGTAYHSVPLQLPTAKKPQHIANEDPVFVVSEQPKPKDSGLLGRAIAWPVKTTFVSHNMAYPHVPAGAPIQIEEVAPAKLLEVTDNDGDSGNEVWQAGGRSQGGKGARSLLANYLKELHKRLKRAWSPPAGTSSGKAEILFRLRRDGQLCSIKLASSSGDPAVDQSALGAISACAPYAQLPGEYTQEYLDLRYTFNYTADELKAVENVSVNAIE